MPEDSWYYCHLAPRKKKVGSGGGTKEVDHHKTLSVYNAFLDSRFSPADSEHTI
jgi:hypothetical protein